MKMMRLTGMRGEKIYVNPMIAYEVTLAGDGSYIDSPYDDQGQYAHVSESPEEVVRIWEEALSTIDGGKKITPFSLKEKGHGKMKIMRLTCESGKPIYINPMHIESIYSIKDGTYVENAYNLDIVHVVMESPEEVVRIWEEAIN